MTRFSIPAEALINLRHRLEMLPSRCRERRLLVEETAQLYGVSSDTLYRALRNSSRPKSIHRSDSGTPRKLSLCEMELYCEVIAALKIRTCNKKGRHVSTARKRTHGWKIGYGICPRAACAKCAVGSAFVLLPANRNGVK